MAKDMSAVVRQQLDAGRTPEQVKDYFVARYGEWILLRPAARGFNWVVYLLPYVALAGGGVLLAVIMAFARQRRPDHGASACRGW